MNREGDVTMERCAMTGGSGMVMVWVFLATCGASAAAQRPTEAPRAAPDGPVQFSGRYPHLAAFNDNGECGIGAVVPWADTLWFVTYAPHHPGGGDDKLYTVDDKLKLTVRPESIGGTPANRMIHRESNQLFIGPYVIDATGGVRVIPYETMFGRPTANARHLTDPANRVYLFTMEEGLYDVDVRTLAVTTIHTDTHKGGDDMVPGYHGKGAYSAQGRLVVANNGEKGRGHPMMYDKAGCLAEWNGREWNVLAESQHCEVTGPGGIAGTAKESDPLWATGWDKRSVLLDLLDGGKWHTFRLPIADYSYVARHGWHTEWPRIREVVPAGKGRPPKLLMNMHGGWFDFPITFSANDTSGLRPIGTHLKITGDFTNWNGRLVFGCDDTAASGFSNSHQDTLNRLNGQSQSNLWFATWDGLRQVGQPAGWGGVWLRDDVQANTPSHPYLFAGYSKRVLHLSHASKAPVTFTIEVNRAGDGAWAEMKTVAVPAGGYTYVLFGDDEPGQWVRLRTDRDASKATAYFHYGLSAGAKTDASIFASLPDVDDPGAYDIGVIRVRGARMGTLHLAASGVGEDGKATETGYYEIGPDMNLNRVDDAKSHAWLKKEATITGPNFTVDDASVIVSEGNERFRLPKGSAAYDRAWPGGWPRGVREVVTERSLFNAHGTFYMLPRTNSSGVRGIKPICTHNKRIADYCSWRGMLVIAGTQAGAKADGHYVAGSDGKAGLWFGDIDDLWKLGKPVGRGGPLKETPVMAGAASDPYLMTGYDRKTMTLSHDAGRTVRFTVEVDVIRDGTWSVYRTFDVPAGKAVTHEFPAGYSAHWVRVNADADCKATAWFVYE